MISTNLATIIFYNLEIIGPAYLSQYWKLTTKTSCFYVSLMFIVTTFSPLIGMLMDYFRHHFGLNIILSAVNAILLLWIMNDFSYFQFILFGLSNSSRNVIQMQMLGSILPKSSFGIAISLARGTNNILSFLVSILSG